MSLTIPAAATESTLPLVDLDLSTGVPQTGGPLSIRWRPVVRSGDVSTMGALMGFGTSIGVLVEATPPPPVFSIRVDSDDGYVAVCDGPTGIFGAGATLTAAFGDFAAAVVEHRDVLARQPRLSDELARQLRYLQQRLPE